MEYKQRHETYTDLKTQDKFILDGKQYEVVEANGGDVRLKNGERSLDLPFKQSVRINDIILRNIGNQNQGQRNYLRIKMHPKKRWERIRPSS